MDAQLETLVQEYNVIMIMKFGSHLYGTNTPLSDTDFKGIYLPTASDILLQKVSKSINITPKKAEQGIKNGADDVDIELYSLQYFIELCLKGETVSIDMLHCPDEMLVYQKGHLWEYLRGSRSQFYSKDLHALVGYCRKQAAKYAICGSRLSDAQKVLNFLGVCDPDLKMKDVWDKLPTGEHIYHIDEFYQVCGRKIQETVKISYTINMLETFMDQYGERARLAQKNEGVDWKAMSHALRFAMQIRDLLTKGDIIFPLEKADLLKDIKRGDMDFKWVSEYLDDILTQVEELVAISDLPSKAPRGEWDIFIKRYHKYLVERG